MSWLNLNDSLNNLKGQITSFASEVLNSGPESGDAGPSSDENVKQQLSECSEEQEVATLKKFIAELQASLERERFLRQKGIKDDNENDDNWNWDVTPTSTDIDNDKTKIQTLQNEISSLKKQALHGPNEHEAEIEKLKEENKVLTTNLEELDAQHQQAMGRLLTLKKELQKNFEKLKDDHEELRNANENYKEQITTLQMKLNDQEKEMANCAQAKSDYNTIQHKYQNLEKIHGLLRDNAVKFQEENQNLHEEVFKLQEKVTYLEHELEIENKIDDSNKTVPKHMYDGLLKELEQVKERRKQSQDNCDEINIDDNAKSVIEKLKMEINELKHKLNSFETEEHSKSIKTDKIMQLYNKYVNFELPVDYVGEIPSTGDSHVVHKLESAFKTLHSFKKDIDNMQLSLSEKSLSISHLKTEIEDISAENEIITSEAQHLEKELKEMRKNNDFLISEIANIKNTSTLQPIIETHEDNIIKLENELEDCNKINKTFESEIKRIETELQAAHKEKLSLQECLKDLKEKYATLDSELETCKTQMNAVNELEHQIMNDKQVQTTAELKELKKLLNESNTKNEKMAIDLHIIENDKVILTNKLDDLKHDVENKTLECNNLQAINLSLEEKIKVSEKEKNTLLQQKRILEESNKSLGERLQTYTSKDLEHSVLSENFKTKEHELSKQIEQLTVENKKLHEESEKTKLELISVKENENKLLNEAETAKREIEILNNKLVEAEKTSEELQIMLLEKKALKEALEVLTAQHNHIVTQKDQLESELNSTRNEITDLKNEMTILNVEKDEIVQKLKDKIDSLEAKQKTADNKTNEENNLILVNLQECEGSQNATPVNSAFQEIEVLKSEIDKKQKTIASMENEISNLKTICDNLKQTIDTITKEKTDLISLVNMKHNESLQYHEEIQRLNKVIFDQTNEFKKILEEKQTLQEEQTKTVQNDSNMEEFNKINNDLAKAMETIAVLSEKCENLEKNLATQVEAVTKLKAENEQLSEREQSSVRELDRLRRHLVSLEDNYTQELMAAEQKLQECQNRLQSVEDRAKQTSTHYTSSSIRATQELETLRTQLRLCEQSRTDLERRVSETEDARSKCEAATVNLQMALMQFQNDKDRDIEAATERIRNKMAEMKNENTALQKEIATLNGKLEESLAGLKAATRLGDQLENKTAVINDLKEQVKTLQTSVAAAEDRYYKAISNQQDRVDKNLVKNLVLNYVMAQGQHASSRTQILRILSSVLDFNKSECERLNLSRSHPQESLAAEFVKFLEKESRPMTVAKTVTDDKEARRNNQSPAGPQPQSSHSRNPSTGSNNILFTAIQPDLESSSQRSNSSVHSVEHKLSLPTPIVDDSGVNQTRNNEGAILMHVLKDI